MYDTYSNWLHSNGFDRRDLKDINDPSWMDELDSEEFQQHYNRHLGYSPYTTCPEYGTCKSYSDVCATGIDNSLTQYFTCTPIEVYNGKTLYIGPRCTYDSISIKLGVYADENCNDYVGRSVDINDLVGEEIDHASLFVPYITGNVHIEIENHGGYSSDISEYYRPIDQICIPCKASRQPYEVLGSDFDFNDDNNNDVNDLCEDLYITSAQCDKSISYRNYNSYKQYSSRKQRSQQELSCDFIQSIVAGRFDQNGFVETSFGIPEIIETWSDISTGEAYGLVIVIAICFILAMWVFVLHHYINEKKPWRMRRRRCLASRHRSVSKVLHDDDASVGSFESEIIYGAPSNITKRIRSAASVVSRTASNVLPLAPPVVSRAASSIASKAMYPFKRTQTWAAGSDHSSAKTESTPNSVEILKMEIDKLRMHLHNTSTSFEANNGFEIQNVTTHQDQISVAEISEIKGSWSEALPVQPRMVGGAKGMANTKKNVIAPPQTCLADEITERDDQPKLESPEPALRYALPTQQSTSVEEDADWDNRLERQISLLDNNYSASFPSHATESSSTTGTNSSRYEWDSAANTLRRIGSSVTGLSSIDENGLVVDVDELQKQLRDLKRHLSSPSSPKASAMRRTRSSSKRSKNKPNSRNKVPGKIKRIFGRK